MARRVVDAAPRSFVLSYERAPRVAREGASQAGGRRCRGNVGGDTSTGMESSRRQSPPAAVPAR